MAVKQQRAIEPIIFGFNFGFVIMLLLGNPFIVYPLAIAVGLLIKKWKPQHGFTFLLTSLLGVFFIHFGAAFILSH